MAEIVRNEILLEGNKKKRGKKQFYKNWKTYAIGLGIIVIGAGTGLGVYFGVIANHNEAKPTAADDIVKAINEKSYTIETNPGSAVTSITEQIDGDFIKASLGNDIKAAFNNELFKFNQITVDDHELNADDLAKTGSIEAKINYDYDAIKNNKTTLKIDIQEKLTLEEAIKVKEVEGNSANSELVIIDEVINLNQDSGVTKEDLEVKSFDSASITNPGKAILTATSGSNFTGDVEIQITQITEPTDQDLINAFEKAFNSLPESMRTISDNLTAEEIMGEAFKKVTVWIIGEVLNNWGWKDYFDYNKLQLQEITVDGREVTDDDLEQQNEDDKYLNLDIKFDYGDIKDETFTAIFVKRVKS